RNKCDPNAVDNRMPGLYVELQIIQRYRRRTTAGAKLQSTKSYCTLPMPARVVQVNSEFFRDVHLDPKIADVGGPRNTRTHAPHAEAIQLGAEPETRRDKCQKG